MKSIVTLVSLAVSLSLGINASASASTMDDEVVDGVITSKTEMTTGTFVPRVCSLTVRQPTHADFAITQRAPLNLVTTIPGQFGGSPDDRTRYYTLTIDDNHPESDTMHMVDEITQLIKDSIVLSDNLVDREKLVVKLFKPSSGNTWVGHSLEIGSTYAAVVYYDTSGARVNIAGEYSADGYMKINCAEMEVEGEVRKSTVY